MSDCTPTTDEVRATYIGEPKHWLDEQVGAEFDRWLAAHDAEKRAEWEAEQGDRRPCRLPHTAPPCTTCRCGARETWDAATKRVAPAEQGELTDALRGYVVPCARCGQRRVIASDALNSDIEVCGRCGVDIGLHELAESEWEYGNEQLLHSHVEVFAASSEAVARAQAWLYPAHRRRKAGPWLPVPGSTVRESDSGVRDSDSEESED